jgi:hypothetical protein
MLDIPSPCDMKKMGLDIWTGKLQPGSYVSYTHQNKKKSGIHNMLRQHHAG